MNRRERWQATMHFRPTDHVPDQEFGYWTDTLDTWRRQGLPDYITDSGRADVYFGFELRAITVVNFDRIFFPAKVGLLPGFEREIIEEVDDHVMIRDVDGATKMIHRDGSSSIPKFVKFALETREDWEEKFKSRLDSTSPGRVPENLEEWTARLRNRDYPFGINIGSLFGWIRDWMGFENVSYAVMDDPALIQEIMEHLTNLILSVIERSAKEIRFDFAHLWEDMCFNHGPILPPKYFEEWMVPRLKRITGLLAESGCDVVMVDCDGNINELVPLWLEAGVNCMLPLEVRGGTDAIELRKKYGHRILLAGGVDKFALIAGKEEIKKEITRLKPLVEDGGYIPHVDHRCPPTVSLENYLYYLNVKRDILGMPEPEPWDVRKQQYAWA